MLSKQFSRKARSGQAGVSLLLISPINGSLLPEKLTWRDKSARF